MLTSNIIVYTGFNIASSRFIIVKTKMLTHATIIFSQDLFIPIDVTAYLLKPRVTF